jgi:hypothetical protein
VKDAECDVKGGKVTITMMGAKTLTRATLDNAFKGTKYCVTSMAERSTRSASVSQESGSG